MTTSITRIAASLLVSVGFALGSVGLASVAAAESNPGSSETSQSQQHKHKSSSHRPGTTGLNGNLPTRSAGKQNQAKHFPSKLEQFKHLPFDPAMPGGD